MNALIQHIHLVSDSTGGTLNAIAKACLVQFKGVETVEHMWNLVRTDRQLKKAIEGIRQNPGPVLYTLVDSDLADILNKTCAALNVPCVPILQPVLSVFRTSFDQETENQPGLQHRLNEAYFERMDAVDYALHHDDGQKTGRSLEEADVILVGVSRTSKTPTCIYLANRGVKAANIPFVPNIDLPAQIYDLKTPLFVGLTERPDRLIEIRKNRLRHLGEYEETDYLREDQVEDEVKAARRFYTKMGWPVIDVTRKSIEETAAEILTLLDRKREKENA